MLSAGRRGRGAGQGLLTAFAVGAIAALSATGVRADDKPIVMKIALVTLDDSLHQYAQNFAAAIEKASGGRIKPEIYPQSKLGSIERQTEGVQFGAIQCQIVAPEFLVGLDERFQVMATPGLVTSMAEGQRLAADPAVRDLMLGLGADKGLHGIGLFMSAQSALVSRDPVRHLGDIKGKKIRIFASPFETVAIRRLGAIPKPMTLAEVLPALQDNALDGAVSSVAIFNSMNYRSAAKYVTETGQPAIFAITEISRKWYDALPADLQRVIDSAGTTESAAINPQTVDIEKKARQAWRDGGGELIDLPADEQASMLKILAGVGDEVSNAKPQLAAAYKTVTEAAAHAK